MQFALGHEIARQLVGTLVNPHNANAPTAISAVVAGAVTGDSSVGAASTQPTIMSNICQNCKTILPANAESYISCGQKVATTTCPKYGEAIVTGAQFCMKCGEKL